MSRALTRFMLPLVAVLVTACNDTADVTGLATETDPLAPAEEGIGARHGKTQRIEALVQLHDAAWAAKDASAFAALYSTEADFVNPVGAILSGREAIRAQHVFLFNGPFAGSTETSLIRRTVFLTGKLAMVDLDVALTGYAFLPPGGALRETEPGVVRTRVKWLLVKHRGNWKIFAQQMTPLPPPPPPPPLP